MVVAKVIPTLQQVQGSFKIKKPHGFGPRSWSSVLSHSTSCALLLKCLNLTLKVCFLQGFFFTISILAIQCFYVFISSFEQSITSRRDYSLTKI